MRAPYLAKNAILAVFVTITSLVMAEVMLPQTKPVIGAGFSFMALVFLGVELWPGTLLGSFIAGVISGFSPPILVANLLIKVLVIACAYGVQRLVRYHPITKHKEIERTLIDSEQSARDFQDKLKALHEVSIELSKTADVDEMCRAAVELGRSHLGFDRLGIWFFDEHDSRFTVGSYGTSETGELHDERRIRCHISSVPMIAEALSSRNSAAFRENFLLGTPETSQHRHGWNAIAILWDGDAALGWISADNYIHQKPASKYQVELLRLYGLTIGHLCTRKRAEAAVRQSEEEARHFQTHLKILNEVSLELSRAQTFDELCRRAIELGRSQMGFERLGLWFYDRDTNTFTGAYGTDEHGQTVDERQSSWTLGAPETDYLKLGELLSGRLTIYVRYEVPLSNPFGQKNATGWQAVTALRDGERIMGVLAADNLVHGGPLSKYQMELLVLYSATVGNLCTNKRAEERLRESEQRFRQIADNIHEVFYMLDVPDHRTLYVSPAYESIWGHSAEAAFQTMDDLLIDVHSDDRERMVASFRQPIEAYATFDGEFRIVRPDRQVRWIRLQHFPVRDDQGAIFRIIGVVEDITERKEAEQRFIELGIERERVRILTEFVRDASHEFRTPLSIIYTKLYLLDKQKDVSKQSHHLAGIKEQADTIFQLVESLVTMSQLDSDHDYNFTAVDLKQILQAVAARERGVIADKGLSFQVQLCDPLPPVRGDVEKLLYAFHNLLNNAVRYTSSGEILIRARLSSDYKVVVQVIDTGIGIDELDLPHIFNRFYRADQSHSTRGLGLGLPISRKIIEQHDGTIRADSQIGRGTTITVTLPIYN